MIRWLPVEEALLLKETLDFGSRKAIEAYMNGRPLKKTGFGKRIIR